MWPRVPTVLAERGPGRIPARPRVRQKRVRAGATISRPHRLRLLSRTTRRRFTDEQTFGTTGRQDAGPGYADLCKVAKPPMHTSSRPRAADACGSVRPSAKDWHRPRSRAAGSGDRHDPAGQIVDPQERTGSSLTRHRASAGVHEGVDKAKLCDELRQYDARGMAPAATLRAGGERRICLSRKPVRLAVVRRVPASTAATRPSITPRSAPCFRASAGPDERSDPRPHWWCRA